MRTSSIKRTVEEYLTSRPDEVAFLRSEFDGCGQSRSGVNKALQTLIRDGKLIKVGYGSYVKAKTIANPSTGDLIVVPSVFREQWGAQMLRKLGVDPKPDSATRAYNENRSTQVPAWFAFDVGSSRIRRKIEFGKGRLVYERSK